MISRCGHSLLGNYGTALVRVVASQIHERSATRRLRNGRFWETRD